MHKNITHTHTTAYCEFTLYLTIPYNPLIAIVLYCTKLQKVMTQFSLQYIVRID